MDQGEKNEILKLLKSIPSELRVFESGIQQKSIEEYYKILGNIELLDSEKGALIYDDSWKELKSKDDLKILLVKLSRIGDIKSYRKIEEIIREEEKGLKDLAHVALKFTRLALENKLSDVPVGFIATALGGKGSKLRYYFVIKSNDAISKEKRVCRVDPNASRLVFVTMILHDEG